MWRLIRKLFRGTFWIRKALALLPRGIRFGIYRNLVSMNYLPSEDLKFKVAETQEELEAAFAILHDAYVGSGFMEKHESGMRITPYHALPSTSTLIATYEGEVIATVSIVRKSSFGFPLEALFDVSEYEQYGNRIAEISSLAIKKSFRGKGGDVLWPLLKFMYEYCTKYFGIDFLMIAVNPNRVEFYEALMFFELLNDGEVYKYEFVRGVEAVGGVLELRFAYQMWASIYSQKKPDKNLFMYFTQISLDNFHFPDRKYFKISDPVMTPQMLKYFFTEKSKVFDELSEKQMETIASQYNLLEYSDALQMDSERDLSLSRLERRFDVRCKARVIVPISERIVRMDIIDVSRSGFRAKLEKAVRFGSLYNINVAIGEFDIADLKAYPIWSLQDNTFGFLIHESSENWITFNLYLEELESQQTMISESA